MPRDVRKDPVTLKNYVMTEPTLSGYDAVEKEINNDFFAQHIDIHIRVGIKTYEQLAEEAQAILDKEPFKTFSDRYCAIVNKERRLAPWVLWACLEERHENITIADTKRILAEADRRGEFFLVWTAAKNLFFDPPKNEEGVTGKKEVPVTPPTPESTPTS